MGDKSDRETGLSDIEKAIVSNFLDRVSNDAAFREAVLASPDVVLATAVPTLPLSQLLRPNLLEALSKLRRVALEEAGINVTEFRHILLDNGFKMMRDDKGT